MLSEKLFHPKNLISMFSRTFMAEGDKYTALKVRLGNKFFMAAAF